MPIDMKRHDSDDSPVAAKLQRFGALGPFGERRYINMVYYYYYDVAVNFKPRIAIIMTSKRDLYLTIILFDYIPPVDGSVKDVTHRYDSKWLIGTQKLRVEPEWWEETL